MDRIRKAVCALLGVLALFMVAALPAHASVPAAPAQAAVAGPLRGTAVGIFWGSNGFPGGIGMTPQYQNTYNGSQLWSRMVGFHEWVGDGSCFLAATVTEYHADGTPAGRVTYSWTGSPCHTSILTDATAGHAFTLAQMPWMEAYPAGSLRAGLSGVTTSVNGSEVVQIAA